jgi:hypothetical protein
MSTPTRDEIERVRQAIMRFRELLNLADEKLKAGEQAYARLFDCLTDDDREALKVKEQQTLIAQHLIEDLSPLAKSVLTMQYEARDLERAFDELYNIIISVQMTDSC